MNQTEALVSIDINSGKATREHNIEDTALKTNLEAAVEIARQLRLRDLAGLIVIDFIDMDENRNNKAVERKLKDALKNDRARIQVGRISHFGLLEMSRQRLRQGMMESSTMQCAHCEGTGVIRGVSSCALSVLRGIEENLLSRKPESMDVRVHPDVAFYIFNEKRDHLLSLEANYGISIYIMPDAERGRSDSIIERKPDRKGPTLRQPPSAVALAMGDGMEANEEPIIEDEYEDDETAEAQEAGTSHRKEEGNLDENGEPRKKRRRRRGRRGGRKQRDELDEDGNVIAAEDGPSQSDEDNTVDTAEADESDADTDVSASGEEKPKKRRRRSRGGRGRSSRDAAEANADTVSADDTVATDQAVASDDVEAIAPADIIAEPEADQEDSKPKNGAPRKAAKKAAKTDEVANEGDEELPAKKPRKRAAKKANAEEDVAEVKADVANVALAEAKTEAVAKAPPPPKWQPPAPTVDPETAPKKAGWWGKR